MEKDFPSNQTQPYWEVVRVRQSTLVHMQQTRNIWWKTQQLKQTIQSRCLKITQYLKLFKYKVQK